MILDVSVYNHYMLYLLLKSELLVGRRTPELIEFQLIANKLDHVVSSCRFIKGEHGVSCSIFEIKKISFGALRHLKGVQEMPS